MIEKDQDYKIEIRKNSFDVLRLIAAISVMLLHYTHYALEFCGGGQTAIKIFRRLTAFYPGVLVLFAISGFLISASYERSSSPVVFIKKRLFRLVPGYYAQTIANIVVLIIFTQPYHFIRSFVKWICAQLVFIGYTPGFLSDFATGSVNGALWTVPVEIQLYVVVMLLYPLLKKMSTKAWIVVLIGLGLLNVYWEAFENLFENIIIRQILGRLCFPYMIWFFIGCFCYLKKEQAIPFLTKYIWLFVSAFVILAGTNISQPGYYSGIITSYIVPFITIGLAFKTGRHTLPIDISYGIYLYHWLVLNVMVHLGMLSSLPWEICILLFITITVGVAMLSYKFIEMPAIRKKEK